MRDNAPTTRVSPGMVKMVDSRNLTGSSFHKEIIMNKESKHHAHKVMGGDVKSLGRGADLGGKTFEAAR